MSNDDYCASCSNLVVIDSDDQYRCEKCGDILCQSCLVFDSDDDEITYCNRCCDKIQEEEVIYKCLECNENLYYDFFNNYICNTCKRKNAKKGVFRKCKVCANFIMMNNKNECQCCEKTVCGNCYIIDDEDYIICKKCEEKD